MSVPSPWDANPLNTAGSGCTVHGPHVGLICGGCQAARWTADPPPRHETSVRAYARVLGAEPADVDPGGRR